MEIITEHIWRIKKISGNVIKYREVDAQGIKGIPRRASASRIAISFVIVLLLACALYSVPSRLFSGAGVDFPFVEQVDPGEALIHGVHLDHFPVSYFLPVTSVSAALLFNHGQFISFETWRVLIVVISFFLILSLGFLMAPPACPILALAFLILAPDTWYGRNDYTNFVFSLFVLMTAGLLVWRAREPSLWRSLVLGLAFGVTLLTRSALAFFPPLLAVFEWNFLFRRSVRSCWKHLALTCFMPYLFLIPWIHMNLIVHGRFIPFEDNAASANIVTAAAGFVHVLDARWKWQEILGNSGGDNQIGKLFRWSIEEVFRHPFRYAESYLARIGYALALHPYLFLWTALALWVYRKRKEFQYMGLLIVYILLIFCCMAVQEAYFLPLWPLVTLMSASLPVYFWNGGDKRNDSMAYCLSAGFVRACLVLALGFCLGVVCIVSAYAHKAILGPPKSQEVLESALNLNPHDAWLLFERGRRKLGEGDVSGAVKDFSRSVVLRPGHEEWEAIFAWARMLDGNPAPLFQLESASIWFPQIPIDLYLYKAHGYMKFGLSKESREQLRLSLENSDPDFRGTPGMANADKARDDRVSEKLRYISAHLASRLTRLLNIRPPGERLVLIGELAKMEPSYGSFWLEHAALALEDGKPTLARRSLAKIRGLKLEPFELQRAARLQRVLAEATLRVKDRRVAQNDISRVESLRSDDDRKRRIAQRHASLGNFTQASQMLEPLSRRFSGEAAYWVERAEVDLGAGARESAPIFLARAESLRPSVRERHRIAMGYQALRDYERALTILRELATAFPATADYLKDLGLCEHLSGLRKEAVGHLQTAIALDPTLLSAYLTLGAIQSEAGSYDQALKTYDAALSVSIKRQDGPLRSIVARSREELISEMERRRKPHP